MVFKLKKTVIAVCAFVLAILAVLPFLLGFSSVSVNQSGVSLPVVMYHQLTKSESRAGKYVLTVEQFEKDLKFLKESGYQSVTVNQLIDFANGKGQIPEKVIMITFDDGCETLYAYALPLLEKYGFTAVGFVIGALADYYSENDDHNLNYSYLNWSEIKELCQGSIIDIQSHSYDLHKNTANRSGVKKKKYETVAQYSEFLSTDMAKMKEKMAEHTGKTPVAFAYPFGSYSVESAAVLKNCGIKMVFTCEERVNSIKKAESDWLFRLGRYNRPNGISSESFFEKMGIC